MEEAQAAAFARLLAPVFRSRAPGRPGRGPGFPRREIRAGRAARQSLTRALVLADDLTGAADCAAGFLGRAAEVRVSLEPRTAARGVTVIDLNTRARPVRAARAVVARAFRSRAAREANILYKKIDSTIKGHVSAELAAARPALGRRAVLFAPAFPAQGRITRQARLVLRGKPVSADLRPLLARAGLPASHVDLATVRAPRLAGAFRAALSIGGRGLVCDAVTDSDLDRIARAGLELRPRPLFVGSAGLARALARTLPRQKAALMPKMETRPVITVVGSASPVSRRQVARLASSRIRGEGDKIFRLVWNREPLREDIARVRRLGRSAARAAPAHYVLTGGETARALLAARKIRGYRLLGEVEPGVPFGLARDGTLVCTKAGAFGKPNTLVRCVARLKQATKDT